MNTSGSTTVRHSALYLTSNMIRQLVSFIMLPIYTRFLTPSDYGIVEMLVFSISILQILMGLRMFEALFKYYYETDDETTRKRVVSTAFLTAVLACGAAAVFLVVFSRSASQILLGSEEYQTAIILYAIMLPASAAEEFAIVFLRLRYQAVMVFAISMAKLVVQLSLNILFLVYLEMHYMGVVWSAIISTGILSLLALYYVWKHAGFRMTTPIFKKMVVFNAPMWLAQLGSFYITYGDRYFLRIFTGLDELGIYSLAYRFGFLLMIMSYSPFEKVWESQAYELHKQPNPRPIFQRVFLNITFAMCFIGLGIATFAKDVIRIMANEPFWSAHTIVPILMIAYLFQGWMYFCNFSLMVSEQTKRIAQGAVLTCIVITIAYLSLIPPLGGTGAALATAIAFLVQLTWSYRKGRKHFDMQLPWNRAIAMVALASAMYLLTYLIPESLLPSLFFRSLIIVGFVGLMLTFPLLLTEDRQLLRRVLAHPRDIRKLFSSP